MHIEDLKYLLLLLCILNITHFSVAQGADPNCETKDGIPAIVYATMNNHVEAIPVLADAGAEINRKTPSRYQTSHMVPYGWEGRYFCFVLCGVFLPGGGGGGGGGSGHFVGDNQIQTNKQKKWWGTKKQTKQCLGTTLCKRIQAMNIGKAVTNVLGKAHAYFSWRIICAPPNPNGLPD